MQGEQAEKTLSHIINKSYLQTNYLRIQKE